MRNEADGSKRRKYDENVSFYTFRCTTVQSASQRAIHMIGQTNHTIHGL